MIDDASERDIMNGLAPFSRRSVTSLGEEMGMPNPVTSRTVWSLSKRMLKSIAAYPGNYSEGDLQVRSVILSSTGRPTQSMSFASFDYNGILNETWEKTEFHAQLDSRFLFMRYLTMGDDTIVFDSAKFWSMPEADMEEAHGVWDRTVAQIRNGQAHALPSIGESPVAHVRPRAANAADRIMAPDGTPLTRKCFWLNSTYVARHVI